MGVDRTLLGGETSTVPDMDLRLLDFKVPGLDEVGSLVGLEDPRYLPTSTPLLRS